VSQQNSEAVKLLTRIDRRARLVLRYGASTLS